MITCHPPSSFPPHDHQDIYRPACGRLQGVKVNKEIIFRYHTFFQIFIFMIYHLVTAVVVNRILCNLILGTDLLSYIDEASFVFLVGSHLDLLFIDCCVTFFSSSLSF